MGRRPVLLIAMAIMTLCTVWCGLAKSYDSLLAARIFQGIGGGAADTVAPALIGDVFFMDRRGRAMVSFICLHQRLATLSTKRQSRLFTLFLSPSGPS